MQNFGAEAAEIFSAEAVTPTDNSSVLSSHVRGVRAVIIMDCLKSGRGCGGGTEVKKEARGPVSNIAVADPVRL